MSRFFAACLFCAVLFMTPVTVFICRDNGVLEDERRKSAAFPAPPERFRVREIKKFFKKFDMFFADHFPLRFVFLSFSSWLREIAVDDLDTNKCYRGKMNWLFLGNDYADCVDKLQGKIAFSEHDLQKRSRFYKAMHDEAQRHGAEFVVFIGPNKSSIYPEYLPPRITPSPNRYITPLLDSLRAAGVKVYDPTERLVKRKQKALLYYRTDTHWNRQGAYEAFEGFREYLGLPELPPLTFVLDSEYYTGNLIDIGGYKKFPFETGDSFSLQWSTPATHAVSAKTAWIFGDSFTERLKPYIHALFSEVKLFQHEAFATVIASQDKKPDIIIWIIVERGF